MRISLRQGSLTDGDETVLVNASNTNARLGSGVSAAIRNACGAGYQAFLDDELSRQFGGAMTPGEVMVTHAGAHPRAKFVAHVAVMDYRDGFGGNSFPTLDTIRAGCERLWRSVERLPGDERHSVAMVALGGGTGGLGVTGPTRLAAATLASYLEQVSTSRIERVTFYGYQFVEYVAMAHVLVQAFPALKDELPPTLLSAIAQRG
ncbi:MAG: macro domain-containing protein [Myxococcaceae bacterium]|nr:macro domain-containing protein [Myxococcaceae bacterium]